MCGIAGFVAPHPIADDREILRRMADAIAHRGPDGEGYLVATTSDRSAHAGLAHRRLAIIDLETGQQPIGNEDSQISLVFNGEIYNFAALRHELVACGHLFRTQSDSEV